MEIPLPRGVSGCPNYIKLKTGSNVGHRMHGALLVIGTRGRYILCLLNHGYWLLLPSISAVLAPAR